MLLREIKRGINLSRRCLAPIKAHWADLRKTSHIIFFTYRISSYSFLPLIVFAAKIQFIK